MGSRQRQGMPQGWNEGLAARPVPDLDHAGFRRRDERVVTRIEFGQHRTAFQLKAAAVPAPIRRIADLTDVILAHCREVCSIRTETDPPQGDRFSVVRRCEQFAGSGVPDLQS